MEGIYLKSFTKNGDRMPRDRFVKIIKGYLGEEKRKWKNEDFLEIAQRVKEDGWNVWPLWGKCTIEETIACSIFDCRDLI